MSRDKAELLERVASGEELDYDDAAYLQQRGLLPEDYDFVATHEALELADLAHTGDVNTGGVTKAELEATAAESYELPDGQPSESEDAEETDEDDYSTWKADELRGEIAQRNQGRDESKKLSLNGTKAELIARLEEDDESDDEDEDEE